jgi:membrane-bound ClpP family serine protease
MWGKLFQAFINNQYFEVTSTGGLIDQETEIRVVKIEGKKIFVKLNT